MRKLTRRLVILTVIILLPLLSLLPTTTAQMSGESSQCPVIRQLCKDTWDSMKLLCLATGGSELACENVRWSSYNSCVLQDAMELGISCTLRDELLDY